MTKELELLKEAANRTARLLKHQLRWGDVHNHSVVGGCIDCCLPCVVQHVPGRPRGAFMTGLALNDHCEGKHICYTEARYLSSLRPSKRGSVPLGINLRLVELSSDTYGLQYHNTYVVRISQSGVYVLNPVRRDEETLKVLNSYTPVELELVGGQFYYKQTKQLCANLDTIDSLGNYLPPLLPKVRQRHVI